MFILRLMAFILIYVGILNVYTFIMCCIEKSRVEKGIRRSSESRLLSSGLIGGCFGLLLGIRVFNYKPNNLKLILCTTVLCVIWGIALLHIISALTLDRRIEFHRVTYSSPKLTQSLDGYTIAFITDTHDLPEEDLLKAVEKLNGYHPELLLLGGDFHSKYLTDERSMEILSTVMASDGIYGVEGNHDNYKTLFSAMKQYEITPLSNNGIKIRNGLFICGTDDLWNRYPDITKAASDAGQDDFVLLVAHNPDVTMIQDTNTVDLVLSGHTHGGQATFLGLWAPALSLRNSITDYGQRFLSGWTKSRDGVDVLVSNGTGTFSDVPRIFARPQVILLTLHCESNENDS